MKIRSTWVVLLAAAALSLSGLAARAADLPAAAGPVLLTVAGAVDKPNRGPVDPFADGFFGHHDIAFERAAEFDLAMLEALGLHEAKAGYPGWPGVSTFAGPLLADVLAAAGAAGRTLRAVALDGYAVDIPPADLEKFPVILAVKRDGRYLGIGGRGPIWVVYPREDFPELQQAKDDAALIWSVFVILVE